MGGRLHHGEGACLGNWSFWLRQPKNTLIQKVTLPSPHRHELSGLEQTETGWAVVSGGTVEWSGVLPEPPSLREQTALSVDNGVLVVAGPDCSIDARLLDSSEKLWSSNLAFSLNADVELVPDDGVVVALSHEWYDAKSIQLFDLKTGAAGPWLNIVDTSWPIERYGGGETGFTDEFESEYFVRVPPWGDRLRHLLIDAARTAG